MAHVALNLDAYNMMRITSKYKVCKRLGTGVFEKCQSQKFSLAEARFRKAKKKQRPLSDYGKQLLEKQRIRFTYGIAERQFGNYVQAVTGAVDPSRALFETLEMRLDSIVFRLGLTATRRAARQLVSHGHITVNGRRVTVPSYHISVGDVIAVREGSKQSPLFARFSGTDADAITTLSWVQFDQSALSGKVTGLPPYTPTEGGHAFPLVFEYYSR